MESHLPGAVSDLLANGLEARELASLMMIPSEDVAKVAAGEEPPSLNVPGAIRLGMAIYILEDLKKTEPDPKRRQLLVQTGITLKIIEGALSK